MFWKADSSDISQVFIVTGASSGLGKELTDILYSKNAKIYIATRSSEKASQAIEQIKPSHPQSTGELVFLHLDLQDLSGIKKSAEEFLSKENKLDILWNNAGVMIPPKGTQTKQGYELQLGTNALGPFLFTKLLVPTLLSTAKTAAQGSVRVIWLSSSAAENFTPKGGVDLDNLDYKTDKNAIQKYAVSKAANILYSQEFSKRYGNSGVLTVSVHPGDLKTNLQRHAPTALRKVWQTILHSPINGAYTELYAGLSPDISKENNNAWIIPWGRFGILRKDIEQAGVLEKDGGSGIAEKFWEWSEAQVQPYA